MLRGKGAGGGSVAGGNFSFFDFYMQDAGSKQKKPIGLENIFITELTDTRIGMKIKF